MNRKKGIGNYPKMSIAVTDELLQQLEKHPYLNVSAICRKAITHALNIANKVEQELSAVDES